MTLQRALNPGNDFDTMPVPKSGEWLAEHYEPGQSFNDFMSITPPKPHRHRNKIYLRDLRREFGRDLRLIGGIDLDVLRLDKEAIKREVHEKLPPLLAQGGFVPLADGRVRADVPLENYIYYRRLFEKVTQG